MDAARRLIQEYRECREAVIRGNAPLEDLDRFFNLPCFMVGADGEVELYASRDAVQLA